MAAPSRDMEQYLGASTAKTLPISYNKKDLLICEQHFHHPTPPRRASRRKRWTP